MELACLCIGMLITGLKQTRKPLKFKETNRHGDHPTLQNWWKKNPLECLDQLEEECF